jgi:hypothetical protein
MTPPCLAFYFLPRTAAVRGIKKKMVANHSKAGLLCCEFKTHSTAATDAAKNKKHGLPQPCFAVTSHLAKQEGVNNFKDINGLSAGNYKTS